MTADTRTAYQRGRILAAIADEALTAQQLADKLHLTRDGINIHLKAMKAAAPRLVHVASWVYNTKGGRPAPQYRPGDKPDAVYVASRTPTRHLQRSKQKERAMRLLCASPRTAMQLSEEMNLSIQWATQLVRDLRAEGRVHIGGWQRQTAGIAPLYAAGNRRDVPKPPPDPQGAYKRRMAKVKSDPDARERYERAQKRRQMKARIAKLVAKPQPWFAALMT